MNRSRLSQAAVLTAIAASVLACGDDDASSAGSGSGGSAGSPAKPGTPTPGGTSGASGSSDAGDAGTRPPPSPLATGWQKAFRATSAGINCNQTLAQMTAAGATSLKVGASTLVVGFEQIGQNQDPIFARFEDTTQKYCEHHEREAPDGRAYGVTWDGGKTAYVVYTIVGGGSAFDALGKGQWLDRYGDGGGSSKVSFVGEVETDFGTLVRGTFVIAKKKDGKTNSHTPADAPIVLASGDIEFQGDSAFQPMNPDKSIMECTNYPFASRYVFSRDLKTLSCASSTNCKSAVPCPP